MFYDVRFDAIAPKSADSTEQEEVIRLIINVEAQTKFKPGYPLTKRAIYYCSRMISAQHGPIFTKSEYGKIRKPLYYDYISIICSFCSSFVILYNQMDFQKQENMLCNMYGSFCFIYCA